MSLRAFLSVLLVPVLLAGCLSETPAETAAPEEPLVERVPPAVWQANLTKPIHEAIESALYTISADDGTKLSLTVHLPEDLPKDTKVPTLLQITPYQPLTLRKSTPFGTDSVGQTSWASYVLRGAAYVEADARGTNGSEGCLDFGGAKDRADAKAFVEWIRAQPWSDGVVVTDGVSHPGMGSVVAHAAVPGLTAALAHAPVVSYYQDEWLQGAKFEDQFNGPAYQAIELAPPAYTDPDSAAAQAAPCTGETTLDYTLPEGTFTPEWADRDLSRHTPQEKIPILLTHGFVDHNVHPDHTQLYWDALPDDHPKHLVMGWWYHSWPDMTDHPAKSSDDTLASFDDLRHRWLDATLFGLDNGLWAEPRVLVEDSRGTWHESDDWPLSPSETTTWYGSAEGGLGDGEPAEGTATYTDRFPAYRGEWTDASVTFRSEPLEKDMLVNGAPTVDLVASSSATNTKWVVYLLDEAPDGTWNRITHGYADSHSHGGEDKWLAMEPGAAYEWVVKLMPIATVVEEGHRIVLLVASQDSRNLMKPDGTWNCWDDHRDPQGCHDPSGIVPAESVGRAENTIHLGPDGTRVHFAWADPETTQKVPWPAV
ncbi:MAG: CocE/NonD family hydrolase [Euryarchaeota archaeon]|nr:CocE/NonD family hydrolase [Euryarchaeota archaeon]